jgi:hypothetical protein
MKKETVELVEHIKARPESFFDDRSSGNYDLFLELYQQVGYAPVAPDEIARWRERSCKTWKLQESIRSGSCTGGLVDGQIVSGAGTLPMTKRILYGHSFCMVKTLGAAATLFAQSLHSVDTMEAFPEMNFWAGSYAYRAHFTPRLQRPSDGAIAEQIEVEVVRLLKPQPTTHRTPVFTAEAIAPDDVTWMCSPHLDFFRELSSSHPSLSTVHGVSARTLVEASSGVLKGAAITQTVPSEFTASNVFSWTWVFPAPDVVVNPEFIGAIRSMPEIGPTGLQIVLQTRGKFSLDGLDEPVIPAFWALTPRKQLGPLRRSLESAFATLLDRYPAGDLASIVRVSSQVG